MLNTSFQAWRKVYSSLLHSLYCRKIFKAYSDLVLDPTMPHNELVRATQTHTHGNAHAYKHAK